MRLKHLYLKDFKNLKDFSIDFDDESFIDIVIGKNGSGKSNLFEAIIEIFKSFVDKESFSSDFKIIYNLDNNDITIENKSGKLFRNGKETKGITKKYLPENILIYYSGHNERVASLIDEYEDSYRNSIRGNEVKELRRFFGISNEHKSILMMILLLLSEENKVRQSIVSQLNISKICSDIKITLKKPHYYKNKSLEAWDNDIFWGVKGYLSEFLPLLDSKKSSSEIDRHEGYFDEEGEYIFYFSPETIKTIIAAKTPEEIFQYFDDLRVIGMLSTIDFEIKLVSGKTIAMHNLSDGEFQAIFFNGLLELFKEKNYIMLLDEPDAFLHPEWQFKLVKQIIEQSGIGDNQNHILLNSHNASTLVSSGDASINLLEIKDNIVKNYSVSKKYAISQLSSGLISLDEEKQTLYLINKIRLESKPVLFTEGTSDPIVIETAWTKLRTTDMPFIPIYAFNNTYLGRLIQDENIYNENDNHPLFGLFDFDESFNIWNGISGTHEETDPFKGLCKKIENKNGYVFLLPVPNNEVIKSQVIKNETTNETFKHESKLTLELLFYGLPETADYFDEVPIVGAGRKIVFKGNKIKFAQNVVPTLPTTAFEVFESMFNIIESKIVE